MAARLTPTTVSSLVKRQFQAALASKDLVFAPSTVVKVPDGGVHFDVLHAPAFAIKPGPAPAAPPPGAPKPKPFNPFLPPQRELHVGVVDVHDEYNVVLNKFTVVENHILLTTRDFKQQSCILAPQEISALWSCMTGFGPHAFGFHNGGLTSGASVPHRHLQVLEYEMPITRLVDAHVERTGVRPWTAFQVPELPFHHVFVSIPENASPDAVHEAYVKALHLALGKEGVEALNSVDVSFDEGFVTHAPGSNLMVTRKWLYVVPRTDPRPGIHIHSMGLSGLIVATTEEEIEFLRKNGPMNVLKKAGVPKRPLGEGKL